MKPENRRMQDFLAANGIKARAKYIATGSLKKTWRLYDPDTKWTVELGNKLTALGFTNYDHGPFGAYAGNGGIFSVFARISSNIVSPD